LFSELLGGERGGSARVEGEFAPVIWQGNKGRKRHRCSKSKKKKSAFVLSE